MPTAAGSIPIFDIVTHVSVLYGIDCIASVVVVNVAGYICMATRSCRGCGRQVELYGIDYIEEEAPGRTRAVDDKAKKVILDYVCLEFVSLETMRD